MTLQTESSPTEKTTLTFSDLVSNPELVESLTKIGITKPTPVQEITIPPALLGKDLVVQAKTGSGKTLAFSIPLLEKIKAQGVNRGTYGLIISPTRELASQIADVIHAVNPAIKPALLIGGVGMGGQINDFDKDHRIVVGTPGRILDMIRQGVLLLRKCQYLVLDEADEMLSMGFYDDVEAILSKLPTKRQGLFVSATISPRVEMLAKKFLIAPERLNAINNDESAPLIEHMYVDVGMGVTAKSGALATLLANLKPRSAIIFCNTKSDTELVEVILKRRGFNASKINSDLSQKERDAVMDQMRAGTLQYLVATDIAARGLDIEDLELVVNYTLHDQAEVYTHRSGRTGRAGKTGKSVCLVAPQDFGPFLNLKKSVPFPFQKYEAATTPSSEAA